MAMTYASPMVQTPIVGQASVTTALTTRTNITGTTGLTALTAVSTNGTRIDAISIKATATSAAGLIWIWIYDGTTSRLMDELVCTAITGSATVAGDYNYKAYLNFNLPPTYQLYASTTITQNYNVFAYGGTF
jgi:hypothetical protein